MLPIPRKLRGLRAGATFYLLFALPLAGVAKLASVPLFYQIEVPLGGRGELDSVALWVAPDPSRSLLFVTDKTRNFVEIHDPVQNQFLGRLGGSGTQPGKFRRPNGIAVVYGAPTSIGPRDLLLIVERDNNRVSTFMLPGFFYFGSFGLGDLDEPYGIAIHYEETQPQAWITSTGQSPERVFVYDLLPAPAGIQGALNRSFAVPSGAVLESIVIDPVHQRALVCDEGAAADIMVFDMQGNLLERFGSGLFVNDPEGIAIYDTGNGNGYILVSDQNAVPTQYEMFDRRTLASLGHWSGPTRTTDGLLIEQRPLPNLPNGSMFAVHADASVHAYDWQDIALAMGLCVGTCDPTDTGPGPHRDPQDLEIWGYPNPFNPATTVHYEVERPGRVRLEIFDARGRRVRSLADRWVPAGAHTAAWDGRDDRGGRLPSGSYVVRMTTPSHTRVSKLLMLK